VGNIAEYLKVLIIGKYKIRNKEVPAGLPDSFPLAGEWIIPLFPPLLVLISFASGFT